MKIYISGKITGLANFKTKFKETENKLIGFEIFNPAEIVIDKPSPTWQDYMDICIEEIKTCDIIYMQKDWIDSKGAKEELSKAIDLGLKIIYE